MNKNDFNEPGNNFRQIRNVLVEKPLLNDEVKHVNGKYADPEEDEEETEDDLVLGDENELEGDEMEFEVEFEDDLNEDDIGEDDLILDTSDDTEDDEDDEDL